MDPSTDIAWGRSDEGNVESKCGRFRIEPTYRHTQRPDGYWLHYTPAEGAPKHGLVPGRLTCDTIAEAKAKAARLLRRGEVQ